MAFQPHVKRVAAVLAALVDHFGPAVVAQHFALRLQLAEIAANGFLLTLSCFDKVSVVRLLWLIRRSTIACWRAAFIYSHPSLIERLHQADAPA
jgi:hypothetical protein